MRKNGRHLNKFRKWHPLYGDSMADLLQSYFVIKPCLEWLHVISSGESLETEVFRVESWEHVSVSHPGRCPTWQEMDAIKDLFWTERETVMQLHVPKAKHVNLATTCLHLWKPPYEIKLPPIEAV